MNQPVPEDLPPTPFHEYFSPDYSISVVPSKEVERDNQNKKEVSGWGWLSGKGRRGAGGGGGCCRLLKLELGQKADGRGGLLVDLCCGSVTSCAFCVCVHGCLFTTTALPLAPPPLPQPCAVH